MPRIVRNQLSAATVRAAGPGRYTDGNGLTLYVKRSGARSWVQRLRLFGERVDLGLGSADRDSADYVSLAQARRTALENRRMVRDGVDPRRTRTPSFAEAQRAAYAELLPQWRESSRFAEKWVSTMERYVLPRIGAVPVDRIEARHVKRALAPIAAAGKADTVRRTGGRIKATLEWARIEGHFDAPDPVDAVVRALRVAKVERARMAALPHREVSGALEAVETARRTVPVTRHAFRFMVLTAARGMEVRRMEWRDVDLDAATWNRPADKMKAGRAHRVPLSRQALDVLEAARGFGGAAGLVFPAQGKRGQMLPDKRDPPARLAGLRRRHGAWLPLQLPRLGRRGRRRARSRRALPRARRRRLERAGVRAQRPAGAPPSGHAAMGRLRRTVTSSSGPRPLGP